MRHFGIICKLLSAIIVLVFAATAGVPCAGWAQSPGIEPTADRILKKMSVYLAGLEQFSVQTENTLEVVLRSGEKIQYVNPANLSIRRPDKLYANRNGDIVNQEFYYDGKTITLFMVDQKYYAVAEAPSTLDETLDFARQVLDVYAPAGDLLYKDAYSILTEDVVSGSYVGLSVVGGVKCHHLAFRGNEVDWQIWVEDGPKPLPKKLIITSKWIAGAPQFVMSVVSWNLSPKLSEEKFKFVPPKEARKIDFLRLQR